MHLSLFLLSQTKDLLCDNVWRCLGEHDREVRSGNDDNHVWHKALILTLSIQAAENLAARMNKLATAPVAQAYVGSTPKRVLDSFKSATGLRIFVVCGRLVEALDHNSISVVGIYRRVQSEVLFKQFVGRCIRRREPFKPDVTAKVVTLSCFEQEAMYKRFSEGGLPDSDVILEEPFPSLDELTDFKHLDDGYSSCASVRFHAMTVIDGEPALSSSELTSLSVFLLLSLSPLSSVLIASTTSGLTMLPMMSLAGPLTRGALAEKTARVVQP